jgi:hypothetical protein
MNRFNTFQVGFFNPALLSILVIHASVELNALGVELVRLHYTVTSSTLQSLLHCMNE